MAKVKKAYFCKSCGFEAPKWLGRCPSCGEWNTFAEEVVTKAPSSLSAAVAGTLRRLRAEGEGYRAVVAPPFGPA